MTWGGHYVDGGWMMASGGLVLLLALILIGLIIWLVTRTLPERPSRGGIRMSGTSAAEDILRRRFAAGEIDADEYERRLEVLRK